METVEAGGRSLSFGPGMPPHQRRSQLLGYVYSSPLVSRGEDGRRERMDQLGTSEVGQRDKLVLYPLLLKLKCVAAHMLAKSTFACCG
ncbi:hypothetical protein Esi_0183_0031 [Ectocarpus siliculosus]|uniref:Uncharacterized protein n=1 Tax=Ectocarpus siliculosus TaxID=2880 RepID=D7FNX9_ECTSI|nr:hypothetical protein Esi_0183_0031 [Ectocarpus siliculosus]|eukprot:CBJ30248.1 hypothetical protein Esi_0183_0031 [Ectocarpus siliculosus]